MEINSIQISVVVCTYNRADVVLDSLISLVEQSMSPKKYEVIIVDNNSTDNTKYVIEEFIGDHPEYNFHLVKESSSGLSYARNCGIRHSNGEIIAFIDDDSSADPRWLDELYTGFISHHQAILIGGKVLPRWEDYPPDWINQNLFSYFSLLDLGEEEREFKFDEHAIGTNFAVKKSVFAEIGDFNVKLGRKGKLLIGDEETELQQRLILSGYSTWYIPSAIVSHKVPRKRMSHHYIFSRAYGTGQARASKILSHHKFLDIVWYFTWNFIGFIWYSMKWLLQSWNRECRFKNARVIVGKMGYLMYHFGFLN